MPKRPWLRFTLRELILATLVVGLGLALFLRIFPFGSGPSGFLAELQSNDLLEDLIKSDLQAFEVGRGFHGFSNHSPTRTLETSIYFPDAPRSTAASTISNLSRVRFEQSLKDNWCWIHGRSTGSTSWKLYYDFPGGAGVVSAFVARSDRNETGSMIHIFVVEFADPGRK